MKNYSDEAEMYFKKGYNCSQAVFCAFAKDFGLNETIALKLSSSFGGGMGRLREVCGAVTAMFAIAGLKCGYTECDDDFKKQRHYELIQKLANEFKDKYGSIICADLLNKKGADIPVPEKRTSEYYEKRPCTEIVKMACKLLETELF